MRGGTLLRRCAALAVAAAGWGAVLPAQQEPGSSAPLVDGVPELCAACHDEVGTWTAHGDLHATFSGVGCTDCHAAHASRHERLLTREGSRLCLGCHDAVSDELTGGTIHAALTQEGCTGCHDPHASEFSPLLKNAEGELCLSCHEDQRQATTGAHAHPPAAAGTCSACHLPHAASETPLLHTAQGQLCGTCHELADPALRSKHLGATPGEDCTSCHDPHGSDRPGVLRAALHAPFEADECDICHVASGADPTALTAPAGELCLVCHADYEEVTAGAVHPGIGAADAADCVACHSPHGASQPGLLRDGPRRTCVACHDGVAGSFADERFAHPLVSGAGCVGCHDPHGGAGDALLASGGGEATCRSCHTEHVFSHPMGPGVADPSNPGRDVDCMSCHAPHGSRWKGIVRADANRDLCIRCHATADPHAAPGARTAAAGP